MENTFDICTSCAENRISFLIVFVLVGYWKTVPYIRNHEIPSFRLLSILIYNVI